jgi:hypothetical protein
MRESFGTQRLFLSVLPDDGKSFALFDPADRIKEPLAVVGLPVDEPPGLGRIEREQNLVIISFIERVFKSGARV